MDAIKLGALSEHLRRHLDVGLDALGIEGTGFYWNLTSPDIYDEAARRSGRILSALSTLIVDTGEHIGKAKNGRAVIYKKTALGDDGIYFAHEILIVEPVEYVGKAAMCQDAVRRAAISSAAYRRPPTHKASWADPLKGSVLIRNSKPATLPMRK